MKSDRKSYGRVKNKLRVHNEQNEQLTLRVANVKYPGTVHIKNVNHQSEEQSSQLRSKSSRVAEEGHRTGQCWKRIDGYLDEKFGLSTRMLGSIAATI